MTEDLEAELARRRKALDALDDRLVELLAERAALVKDLWALKRRHQVERVDPAREAAVIARLTARATARGLDPRAVAEVLRAVVGKQLDPQEDAMVARLHLEGAVEAPQDLTLEALAALPQLEVGKVLAGKDGVGVRLRELLDRARPKPEARWATLASADGTFAIAVPLADVADNALVAFAPAAGPPLKGGPLRFYVIDAKACRSGQVDACANVKGLGRITLTAERAPDVGHSH